jgi:hypothetical protein
MTVEALIDREGKQANTATEGEEMLRRDSFPLNNDNQYDELTIAGSTYTSVTEQVVERALVSQSVKKGPGLDKLSFGAIRLLWRWDEQRIVGSTNVASRMTRHPAVWKLPSGVMIQKPRKDNCMKLKVYRSISLLSWMGKGFKKVVAELLSEDGKRRGLLSNGEFGSWKGQSAIDAVANMVGRHHAAWTNGHIPGVLLMNIKATFPEVEKGRLVNLMEVRPMDGDLI